MSFSLDRYLQDLELIVNIDSGSKNSKGINQVADFFNERYQKLGYLTEKTTSANLLAVNGNYDNYDVLLIGHMDTVFPEGTAVERPFRVSGNRAYGPGVADMKSGLLLMYYSLKALQEKGLDRDLAICVVLNSDEEIGSKKSTPLIKELAKKSKVALVLEGARNVSSLVLERKGIAGYYLNFTGIAAHAGVEPEKGASAVVELARWVSELNDLNDLAAGTTVNVGVIEGGTAANVIAEQARAMVDLRFKTEAAREKVEQVMEDLKNHPRVKGVKAEVIRHGIRPAMNPSTETMRLIEVVKDIGRRLKLDLNWIASGGGSDANTTAGLGIPTIDGLGPVGANPHSQNEYLELDSINLRSILLTEIISACRDFKRRRPE